LRIINEDRLSGFARKHPEAGSALSRWAAITKISQWRNPLDVRNSFRSADQVCQCMVFDILGNNYRLITRIYYADQTVTLYYFLTHKEYDRGRWKKGCDC
jgi:mRNA interferase HigB